MFFVAVVLPLGDGKFSASGRGAHLVLECLPVPIPSALRFQTHQPMNPVEALLIRAFGFSGDTSSSTDTSAASGEFESIPAYLKDLGH